MIKHIFLNIFVLTALVAFNVNAQDDNDAALIKAPVDYKTQIDVLKPTLGDIKIKDIQHPWLAYVKTVEGKVLVKRHNKGGDILLTFLAEEKDLLTNADIVDVGSNGRIEIEFQNTELVNLGPSTVLRIEQKSSYTLLVGSVRVRTPREKEPKKIFVYAPNVNIALEGNADFVVRYDDKLRTTNLACFDGKLNIVGIRDSKEQKGFEKNLVRGDRLDVITTNEKNKEVYIPTEPEKLSMDSKKEILESFYSDPKQVDQWEYTRLATGFFRFATSFEYAKFSDTAYANFTLGYVPLIYLGSIFYLEPYFHVSFASPFDLFFYRVGGVFQINPFNGAYFGLGGGAFWIHKDTSEYGADFTIHIGYTFAEKIMTFIDGFRLAYFVSEASGLHEKAFMFSVIINIGRGRELY
jgi:hypothetical protein